LPSSRFSVPLRPQKQPLAVGIKSQAITLCIKLNSKG